MPLLITTAVSTLFKPFMTLSFVLRRALFYCYDLLEMLATHQGLVLFLRNSNPFLMEKDHEGLTVLHQGFYRL